MKKIPTIIETYAQHGKEPKRVLTDEPYEYEVVKGEKILVHYWVKYPTYDFIFGTPAPDNPHYKKEFGFFQFRKMTDGKAMAGWNIYVDQDELEEMQKGFTKLMDVSHATRLKEWSERNAKKHKPMHGAGSECPIDMCDECFKIDNGN